MISYKHIADAIAFYRKAGFMEIEVPWAVDARIVELTRPANSVNVRSDYGCLVASAEQSFLQLRFQNALIGRFQATTPCFRNEPEDELHQKYFIKNELFINDTPDELTLCRTIEKAVEFFSQYVRVEVTRVNPGQYDIVDMEHKIELGSYGIRENSLTGRWIYATGCAEPRLSFVKGKQSTNV
jgi:hypothetical protein